MATTFYQLNVELVTDNLKKTCFRRTDLLIFEDSLKAKTLSNPKGLFGLAFNSQNDLEEVAKLLKQYPRIIKIATDPSLMKLDNPQIDKAMAENIQQAELNWKKCQAEQFFENQKIQLMYQNLTNTLDQLQKEDQIQVTEKFYKLEFLLEKVNQLDKYSKEAVPKDYEEKIIPGMQQLREAVYFQKSNLIS